MKKSIFFVLVLIALSLLIATPLLAGDKSTDNKSDGQVLYQPALYNDFGDFGYSNTRLIFRNIAEETIILTRVDLYGPTGTEGGVLHQYVATPMEIGPFASITFIASEAELDFARGLGDGGRYYFIVEWESVVKVMPPIVEAARVIITYSGGVAQSITPATVIEE